MGLFKDWDVTNLTLKRKAKRKVTKKNTLKKRKERTSYEKRTLDLCQVFRHIFLRIFINYFSFARGVFINTKEKSLTFI